MIAQETSLLQQTQIYAESLLKHLAVDYTYHNLSHTRAVVAFANEIADHEKLSDTDRETVLIAAWLHDVGYKEGCDNHEANGINIARPFLEKQGLSPKRIEEIEACIQATKMPQNPQGKRLPEILCDADLGHLSADDFLERSEDLRQEMKHTFEKISKKKWRKKTADFLENHHYFTHYGKTVLEPRQLANLEKLRQQLGDDDAEDEPKHGKHDKDKSDKDKSKHHKEQKDALNELSKEPDLPHPLSESKPADTVKKERKPERGVETMFRLTSANHFQLSSMADTKANIMISINTIVLSLIVSILARKLEEWPILTIPTVMLAVTCLVATVLSVLATRPNVTSGFVSREDIENKTANLLFFGNFHQMGLSDYEWGMRRMMDDSDFLYSSMIRDIYFLGKVLGRKYKLLRWSYSVFMFGLVISVIAFGIATYMSK
ncbi:Pycsar system effector family protein [Spirosoma radiotolerans]|uniref:Phosphohydrolase n=1 Tax=Spirosoma radiotolerans TaxID=1379870 RepID=A0A0E3ZSW9_9BACT|nr:Pycsar system effector family protein [Spirosoma radiotolerans]AKD53734.1 phosphohydrolase [Spirosoma radiotolerans]